MKTLMIIGVTLIYIAVCKLLGETVAPSTALIIYLLYNLAVNIEEKR